MRHPWIVLLLSAIAGTAAVVVSATIFAPGEPTAAGLVSALGRPPAASDPVFDRAEQIDVTADDSRLAGTFDAARIWMAVNARDQLCVIVEFPGDDVMGASCAAPDIARDHGAGVSVSGVGIDGLSAMIVPDDVDLDGVAAPWTVIGPNAIAANTADLGGPGELTLPTADGRVFTLRF